MKSRLALDAGTGDKFVSAMLPKCGCALERRFQMELQADDIAVELKRLIIAGVAFGKMHGSFREIKRFPVPVKCDTFPG